ncbi:putative NOT transcription complex subunit VIP2 [Cardamine amara subsp. amara]|uniref:NOT transcription complex subunit VIP2 n=1 Tax=Cardamine amara subsp. amara TaxID=228776 RepID=A0ABD1BGN9_CARAN
MDLHQKDQLHDNAMSMMHSQNLHYIIVSQSHHNLFLSVSTFDCVVPKQVRNLHYKIRLWLEIATGNRFVWRLKASPKTRNFVWKAAVGALSVGAQLATRGMTGATTCKRCGQLETIPHVMFQCAYYARKVWSLAPVRATISIFTILHEIYDLLYQFNVISFRFIPCTANTVAKRALSSALDSVVHHSVLE